jgi:serine protease Do
MVPRSNFGFRISAAFCLFTSLVAIAGGQDLADLEEQAIRAAVATVAPSVVRIETIGGLEQVGDVLLGEGPTTGVVVSSDGFIVSSAFNFVRQPTSILVNLSGGRRVPAQIVSRDHSRMLVLLKIAAPEPLSVPVAAPMDQVAVGQWAIAVGRTLNAEQPNISAGIVSAKQRIFGKVLQTDAKISPSNYGGPLIDLRGRVLGILVPMSPDSRDDLAGAEWYDGGIGFAVPLATIQTQLERLKRGENLQPGMLGVTLKQGDMYSLPAEVVAAHPKSPVYQAGLRAGDKIIECNGVAIEKQVQLKQVLGPLYAGETVQLVTMRGNKRNEFKIELVDKLIPYEHPFLGVLPTRVNSSAERGVGIRYLYPSAGAEKAGLKVGDRIVQLDGKPVTQAKELRETLAAFEPGKKVSVRYLRGEQESAAEIELTTLPSDLPDAKTTIPPQSPANTDKAAGTEKVNVVEIKIPEEPNECVALVPKSYRPEVSHGVVIYLPQPGEGKQEELVKRWQAACEKLDLIVVAPRSVLPNTWLPTEVGFVRKAIDHVLANYTVDRTRIVVYGYQASGSMAYLTAFRHRDLVRGVVAIDSGISAANRPPDNDPIERLAIVASVSEKGPLKARILAGVKVLREMKYPVTVMELPGEPRDLNDQELENVSNWIDTLDRL